MKLTSTLLACSSLGLLATASARADDDPPIDHWGDAQPPDPTQAPVAQAPIPAPPDPDSVPAPPPPPVEDTPPPTPVYYEEERPAAFTYAWTEPRLSSGIGVGVAIGGGLTGFTDRTMRDTVSSNVGGLWDVRASFGTHIPLGIDVTYLGTAANVNTFDGSPNGTLVGTTVEGALRWNILPHYALDPYLFAGAGWQRYDLTQRKFAQSDSGMKQNDNFAEFPMGAGLSLRDVSGFTVDVRGTFRAAADSTLVLVPGATDTFAREHTWEASAGLGYEF